MSDKPSVKKFIKENFDAERVVRELMDIAFNAEDPSVRLDAIKLLLDSRYTMWFLDQ